ncbi:MAG: hypothetical protein JWM19_806 [Actinomycetia bacterium]|nr:hypothetical protein [Actinomycetes bacterium]
MLRGSGMRKRLARRLFPLLASAGLIAVGMSATTWVTLLLHLKEWALPYDIWGTMIAATRLVHGQIGGIYAQPTGLVSLPGTAVILAPIAAVTSALGLSLRLPGPTNLHPEVWLFIGPYQIAISCVAIFAADALAEHLGVPRWKRGLLALGGVAALWSVSARWGHPEDAVATGLLLYAVLAQARGRVAAAGWLAGAAICVQPLALLAVPMMVALLSWRRVRLSPGGATPRTPRAPRGKPATVPGMPGFLVRGALPSAVLLAAAGIANWNVMYTAVTSQPNSPTVNHPTAWTWLAPHMAGGNVAAGPFRLATIALACLCAVVVRRRLYRRLGESQRHGSSGPTGAGPTGAGPTGGGLDDRGPDSREWPRPVLTEVLWWMALGLALRSFFEPVMVSYYPWPPLAVALIPAATGGWVRLAVAAVTAGGVTAQGQGPWHNVWAWWVPLVGGLLLMLGVGWPRWRVLTRPGLPRPPSSGSSQAEPTAALSLAAASSRSASVAGLAPPMSKSCIDHMGNTWTCMCGTSRPAMSRPARGAPKASFAASPTFFATAIRCCSTSSGRSVH